MGFEVPFRRDFGAFRQEVAKAIGRHVIKDASDITKAEDWVLKREKNEQRLKDIHDALLKRDTPKLKESDIVIVRAWFSYIRSIIDPHIWSSGVEIGSASPEGEPYVYL